MCSCSNLLEPVLLLFLLRQLIKKWLQDVMNVTLRCDSVFKKDRSNYTPLLQSTLNTNFLIVEWLLKQRRGFTVDHTLEFWLFMYPDKWNHASSLKNVWFKMLSPFSRIKFSNHRQNSTRFSESWGFSSWTTCTLYGNNLSWCTARWVDVRDILVSWDKRLNMKIWKWKCIEN